MTVTTAIVWIAYFIELLIAGVSFRRVEFSPLAVLLGFSFAIMAAQSRNSQPIEAMAPVTIALIAAALALIAWSAQTIHGRFFSYLGNHDVPQFVCDQGPYHYIRHPFYASYLLTHVAVVMSYPNAITSATLAATIALLTYVAIFEENKFKTGPAAGQYQAYKSRTGRFIPGL